MDSIYAIAFVALLMLSAFFSSAETALISLNSVRLRLKAAQNDRQAKKVLAMINKPEALFSTLLVGNNLVNVAIASLATVVSASWLGENGEWTVLLSTGVTTLVLLAFGELIPKSLGFRHRERIARYYIGPVQLFYFLFYPFVLFFSTFSRVIMGKEKKGDSDPMSLVELKHLLASEVELFSNEPETLRMVNEIIDLAERDVKSAMTSRIDMEVMYQSEGLGGIRRVVFDKRFLTIPVVMDQTEQVVGIVSAKNMVVPLLSGKMEGMSLGDVMDPPLFVSEFSTLRYVLGQFRRHRSHIAIVVDEYGGTLGMVTQSDIFQNILGTLDTLSAPVQRVSRRVYRILGNLAVEEAQSLLPLVIEDKKDYSTVAGFFIYHYGKLPKPGARLRHNGAVWIVEKLDGIRIEKLKVILEHGNLGK